MSCFSNVGRMQDMQLTIELPWIDSQPFPLLHIWCEGCEVTTGPCLYFPCMNEWSQKMISTFSLTMKTFQTDEKTVQSLTFNMYVLHININQHGFQLKSVIYGSVPANPYYYAPWLCLGSHIYIVFITLIHLPVLLLNDLVRINSRKKLETMESDSI